MWKVCVHLVKYLVDSLNVCVENVRLIKRLLLRLALWMLLLCGDLRVEARGRGCGKCAIVEEREKALWIVGLRCEL